MNLDWWMGGMMKEKSAEFINTVYNEEFLNGRKSNFLKVGAVLHRGGSWRKSNPRGINSHSEGGGVKAVDKGHFFSDGNTFLFFFLLCHWSGFLLGCLHFFDLSTEQSGRRQLLVCSFWLLPPLFTPNKLLSKIIISEFYCIWLKIKI